MAAPAAERGVVAQPLDTQPQMREPFVFPHESIRHPEALAYVEKMFLGIRSVREGGISLPQRLEYIRDTYLNLEPIAKVLGSGVQIDTGAFFDEVVARGVLRSGQIRVFVRALASYIDRKYREAGAQ